MLDISIEKLYFAPEFNLHNYNMKAFLLFGLLLMTNLGFAQQQGYYRSASVNKNTVVFTAEGDLWKFDMATGATTRITTHPGLEINAVISPDGKQVAFSGQLEGSTEVYLMDINGGIPKRLTYDFGCRPVGWTKEGMILYTSIRYSSLPIPQIFKLDPKTLSIEPFPLSQASDGCLDGNILFFTRLPKQSSNNKRYVGGTIQQIWKFDGTKEAECITCDFNGTSTRPMIYKNRLFFVSDRDGSMNIWSSDKEGKSLKQHTFSKEWDIKSPAIFESSIVYQRGADLYHLDIETGKEKILDIKLTSDFDQRKVKWQKNPCESISFTSLSPEGNFVAIVSRGRLFTASAKGGRWIEINRKSGIRFKEAHYLDEKTIVYLSDESGEFELWKTSADGIGTPKQLTKDSKILITSIKASPNGKYIAYTDKDEFLRIIDASSGVIKFQVQDKESGINDMSWSSNSENLTYAHGLENQVSQISVIEISSGKNTPITTTRLDSYGADWTQNDGWLYFLSDRNLKTKVSSPWGPRQPEPYYSEFTNIYGLQISDTINFPFYQLDPWLSKEKSNNTDSKEGKSDKSKSKTATSTQNVSWEKISKNLFQVPIKSNNAKALFVANDFIYWIDENGDGKRKLFALKMDYKKLEPIEIAEDIKSAQLSSNKKKILIFKKNTISVGEANGEKIDLDKQKIELANWSFTIDPVDDWQQMYNDAWRMMRDYFYDRNMHGVNWNASKKQHEVLLNRLTDRHELDDLLAQMVSELAVLHTAVRGGDKRKSPDEIQTGFLGAKLIMNSLGAKISHIYRNDQDFPDELSPLSAPELKIKEGNIITKINDVPLTSVTHYSELLANKVGVPVKLTLLNEDQVEYNQIVKPISGDDETDLRYSEWELTRREEVDKSAKEEIGYIHLRAMSGSDMDDFVKQYYPIFTRKGLIIDVRNNRGGNIDSWVLEKLMRKAWFYWQGRTGKSTWNMQYAFRGHMVLLCDQFTASDGEAIAEGFRRLGLGKVIGMRTWGGEVWLSSSNRLVDNGIAAAPETGVYGPEGKWLIEGHGVDPDFLIDNLPNETFLGKDAQLEFALDYLKKKIKAEPIETPQPPAYPNKSFDYNKKN
jgi:tricorn protease